MKAMSKDPVMPAVSETWPRELSCDWSGKGPAGARDG